jgi:hypothetical protein
VIVVLDSAVKTRRGDGMGKRRFVTGLLMVVAVASGGVAMASPAWAAPAGDAGGSDVSVSSCVLYANSPTSSGRRLSGYGSRWGCGSTVTYFWVRVYKHIPWWPDAERAVRGATHFQNGGMTASGTCDGYGDYYTYSSTATGASGEDRESYRRTIC